MKVMERIVQEIHLDKAPLFKEFQRKHDVVEARLGFPPLRWYLAQYTAESSFVFVCEREWESLAAMEATYAKAQGDPERQGLEAAWSTFGKSHRRELWQVFDFWFAQ